MYPRSKLPVPKRGTAVTDAISCDVASVVISSEWHRMGRPRRLDAVGHAAVQRTNILNRNVFHSDPRGRVRKSLYIRGSFAAKKIGWLMD